ncbi:uncharacterized protein LOC130719788 [Lotus japonicus]|uniref:uncharacterized protein LOC130719788 n=1 Tax=Lotus japonicus TaxID=34305 RepID=UPI002582A940|nr:uncharacterized protein LOC130719788 [Lotus japonicus]
MNQSALLDVDTARSVTNKVYPWKFRARVLSLWKVPDHMLPVSSSSIDMVLIDKEGVKFEASICKSVVVPPKMFEGRVYQISFFRILDNIGPKRLTSIRYKLYFLPCTRIFPAVDHDMPRNGWDFFHMHHIKDYGNTFGYLVDVIGILTAASSEKLMIKDKRVYKTMDIKLSDRSGMTKCVLVGDIVDMLSEYLCADWVVRPIVGLRFVEVRSKNGQNVIYAVPYVTKILINHKFDEDVVLADRFHGVDFKLHVDYIFNLDNNLNNHADMLELHPKKTIPQLLESKEKGTFVVHAWILALLKNSNWYSFKVQVCDGSDNTIFVLNDHDAMHLINVPCEELMRSEEVKPSSEIPPLLEEILVGKELLFKIRAGFGMTYNRQQTYEVLKICDDSHVIKMFRSGNFFSTPMEAKFAPSFTQLEVAHDDAKVEEMHAGNFKCKGAAPVKSNLAKKQTTIISQSSTSIHLPLKRKLEAEFDKFVSEIDNDLDAIDAAPIINIAEESMTRNDGEQNLKCPQIIDLTNTNVDEDFEISPTQIGTITLSDDFIDLTKIEQNGEVTSKEFIDLTKDLDAVDLTSTSNGEEVEVWEVVDLST